MWGGWLTETSLTRECHTALTKAAALLWDSLSAPAAGRVGFDVGRLADRDIFDEGASHCLDQSRCCFGANMTGQVSRKKHDMALHNALPSD